VAQLLYLPLEGTKGGRMCPPHWDHDQRRVGDDLPRLVIYKWLGAITLCVLRHAHGALQFTFSSRKVFAQEAVTLFMANGQPSETIVERQEYYRPRETIVKSKGF